MARRRFASKRIVQKPRRDRVGRASILAVPQHVDRLMPSFGVVQRNWIIWSGKFSFPQLIACFRSANSVRFRKPTVPEEKNDFLKKTLFPANFVNIEATIDKLAFLGRVHLPIESRSRSPLPSLFAKSDIKLPFGYLKSVSPPIVAGVSAMAMPAARNRFQSFPRCEKPFPPATIAPA